MCSKRERRNKFWENSGMLASRHSPFPAIFVFATVSTHEFFIHT